MAEALIAEKSRFEVAESTDSCARPLASVIDVAAGPHVRGKFLFVGKDKFWVRGVTYGTFAPDEDGVQYPSREVVEADFASMAANGINTVRLYTVPPHWLLDVAHAEGLRVMVGLPWEQHVAFLNTKAQARDIEARVREGVRACAGHPAVFCYAVGNEIPASIVRWCGNKRVERFLRRLYKAAKAEDPKALVTYVNYPTTEYLDLSFVDFFTFNVYLEDRNRLSAYLKHLHNIAGEKPVVLSEVGLDSRRNGEAKQGEVLEWQIRTSFSEGCCGTFIFAWTDEWHRGGYDINDWDFGLVTRDRKAKPALDAVRCGFECGPFSELRECPRFSVVICSLNGARTIRDSLEACSRLNYPNYEVIVISDGSTDKTPEIAREYDARLWCTKNQGLSAARNLGLREATGDIIAYVDDDAYPDVDWLNYLALAYQDSNHVGVGGPNLLPPEDGTIAACVYDAPGGPVHVLIDDEIAEHIPGCNMSFRTEALKAIGGFDTRFRAAGDDVDICWRLQSGGRTIGFSNAAMVWHHRRNSVRDYWKQQFGYGKAEVLLEEKWPTKFNGVGHPTWGGHIYGRESTISLLGRAHRIYHGVWGLASFQPLYQPRLDVFAALPILPEWYLVIAVTTGLVALGLNWAPMLIFLPFLVVSVGVPILQALLSASQAMSVAQQLQTPRRAFAFALTTALHLIQPLARLSGRLRYGLTPWRRRISDTGSMPRLKQLEIWDENWKSMENRLAWIEREIWNSGAVVRRGDEYARWDLEIRGGHFASVRILMAVEEHGGGKQLIRLRAWPHTPNSSVAVAVGFVGLFVAAAISGAVGAAAVLGISCFGLLRWAMADLAVATAAWEDVARAAERLASAPLPQEETVRRSCRYTDKQVKALQVLSVRQILDWVCHRVPVLKNIIPKSVPVPGLDLESQQCAIEGEKTGTNNLKFAQTLPHAFRRPD